MDAITQQHLQNLHSKDANLRYASFQYVMNIARHPVDWAYEVWDDLLDMSRTGDNHQRTIAVQLLSSLTKSDPKKRMLKDLPKLFAVTKDEKFVTARHSLQCLWKIGIVSKDLQRKVVDALGKRFKECIEEKNCTLIRYDSLEVLRKIYNEVNDPKLKDIALTWMEEEEDPKYRKKYRTLWNDVIKSPRIE